MFCVLYGLLTPLGMHMYRFPEQVLPGFERLSWRGFLVGLIRSFLYGWSAIALSVLLQAAVVNLNFLNLAFGTVPLDFSQWLLCAAMASVVLWYSELRKLENRAWAGGATP